MEDANLELGGSITLVGFKTVSRAEMVVVKKIVGGYARKLADQVPGFDGLKITLKHIHKIEDSEKFEINASISYDGKHFESEVDERNLFVGLDAVLHKVSEHALKETDKHGN